MHEVDFSEDTLAQMTWTEFEPAQVNQVLQKCEKAGGQGEKMVGVQMLNAILSEELANLQGTAAVGRRQAIQEEIKK